MTYSFGMSKNFRLALINAIATKEVPLRVVSERSGVSYEQLKKITQRETASTNVDDAMKVAAAFGCSLDQFIDGDFPRENTAPDYVAAPSMPDQNGFSESQARPWKGQSFAEPISPSDPITGLSRSAKHAATYEITRPSPSLGLLAGDVLVVDLGQPPQSGDLILIGVTDPTGTEAITLIRRYVPPYAISANASEPNPVINLDSDGTAAWRATIKSMFRPKV